MSILIQDVKYWAHTASSPLHCTHVHTCVYTHSPGSVVCPMKRGLTQYTFRKLCFEDNAIAIHYYYMYIITTCTCICIELSANQTRIYMYMHCPLYMYNMYVQCSFTLKVNDSVIHILYLVVVNVKCTR